MDYNDDHTIFSDEVGSREHLLATIATWQGEQERAPVTVTIGTIWRNEGNTDIITFPDASTATITRVNEWLEDVKAHLDDPDVVDIPRIYWAYGTLTVNIPRPYR
jgi:hypothetical protein